MRPICVEEALETEDSPSPQRREPVEISHGNSGATTMDGDTDYSSPYPLIDKSTPIYQAKDG